MFIHIHTFNLSSINNMEYYINTGSNLHIYMYYIACYNCFYEHQIYSKFWTDTKCLSAYKTVCSLWQFFENCYVSSIYFFAILTCILMVILMFSANRTPTWSYYLQLIYDGIKILNQKMLLWEWTDRYITFLWISQK